jgi:hypothetical protein
LAGKGVNLVAAGLHRLIDKIARQRTLMSDITTAPRRRPLWRLFIMPVLLLIAAAAWSAFWFYSASKVDEAADVGPVEPMIARGTR